MKLLHTPGPWFNFKNTDIHAGNTGITDIRARFANQNGEHIASIWAHGDKETEANARLIAAAPDLLEALEEVMKGVAGCETEPKYQAARAAIKKAMEG